MPIPDFRRSYDRTLWLALVAGLALGCQTFPTLVVCPIPETEQAARIASLVPVGTDREAAIEKLREAGVNGQFSAGDTIFYCQTWLQDTNERWLVNVDVRFDEEGRVYAYRPAPQPGAASGLQAAGTLKIAKPPKQVASARQGGVVDPFAE
jgi:hypothetical protein